MTTDRGICATLHVRRVDCLSFTVAQSLKTWAWLWETVLLIHRCISLGSLLLHDERGERVQHILVQVRLADSKDLRAVDPRRFEELRVFHLQESLATDAFVCTLDQLDTLTEDGKAHLLADQVRVRPQFD